MSTHVPVIYCYRSASTKLCVTQGEATQSAISPITVLYFFVNCEQLIYYPPPGYTPQGYNPIPFEALPFSVAGPTSAKNYF